MRSVLKFKFVPVAAVLGFAVWALPAHAVVPIGPTIQVSTNTNDAGYQLPEYGRAVAMHPDGSFVVVWQDYQPFQPPLDGDEEAIVGRRYDSTGSPLGDQFVVNTFTTGVQESGAVVVTPDGGFVVAWGQEDLANPHVAFRRYDSSGASLGSEVVVASNTATDTIDAPVDIAVAADGSFLIVWSDEDPPVTGEFIRGRLYDSSGSPSAPEFAVNTYTTSALGPYDHDDPAVASVGASGFVVVWNGPPLSGPYPYLDIIGRRVDPAGTPLAADFSVSGPNATDDLYPNVSGATDGSFVVAWSSYTYYPEGVNARRFDSSGAPIGAEIPVAGATPFNIEIAVASEPSGDFVVAWQQTNADGYSGASNSDVVARRFLSDGTASGPGFSVSATGLTGRNVAPSIATNGAGEFIVAWGGPFFGNPGAVIGQSSNMLARRLGDGCSASPIVSCRAAENAKSSFFIKDNASDSKDLLKWNWPKGAATDITDFGDPAFGTTETRLCIYDGSGTGLPISEMSIPPMGTCGTKPCWKVTSKSYKYKDKDATPSGVAVGKFLAGTEGKAKIGIVAKGLNIPTPALPLILPVTVQLQSDTDGTVECWGTVFSGATKNETAQFKAKGP